MRALTQPFEQFGAELSRDTERAMSQENVEIVREAMDAYSRGDKDRWTQFIEPELETFPSPSSPNPVP